MASEVDSSEQLEIHVKRIGKGEDVLSFFIDASKSVLDLKHRIKDELDPSETVPVERQRLIFSGRMLRLDEESLSDAKMKTDSVNCIHLTPLPEGARPSTRSDAATNSNNRSPSSSSSSSNVRQGRFVPVPAGGAGAERRRIQRFIIRQQVRSHPYAVAIPARFVLATSSRPAYERGGTINNNGGLASIQNNRNNNNHQGGDDEEGSSRSSSSSAAAASARISMLGIGRPIPSSGRILALFEDAQAYQAAIGARQEQLEAAIGERQEELEHLQRQRREHLTRLLELTSSSPRVTTNNNNDSSFASRESARGTPLVSAIRNARARTSSSYPVPRSAAATTANRSVASSRETASSIPSAHQAPSDPEPDSSREVQTDPTRLGRFLRRMRRHTSRDAGPPTDP